MLKEHKKIILEEKYSAQRAARSLTQGDTIKSAVFIPILPENETPEGSVDEKDLNELSEDRNLTKPSEELIKEGVILRNIIRNQEKKEVPMYTKGGKKNRKGRKGKKSKPSSLYPALVYLTSGAKGDRNRGHTFMDIKEFINKGNFEIIVSAHGSPYRIGTLAGALALTPKDLADQLGAIFSALKIDKNIPIKFTFNTCNNATVDYRFAVEPALGDNLSKEEKKYIINARDEYDIYNALGQKEKDRFFIEQSFIGKFATGLVNNGFENVEIKGNRGFMATVGVDKQLISLKNKNKSRDLVSIENMEHVINIENKEIVSVSYPLNPELATKTVEQSFEMFQDNYDEVNDIEFEALEQPIMLNDEQRILENEILLDAIRKGLIEEQNTPEEIHFESESESENEFQVLKSGNPFSYLLESDSESEGKSESEVESESEKATNKLDADVNDETEKQTASSIEHSNDGHPLSALGVPQNRDQELSIVREQRTMKRSIGLIKRNNNAKPRNL